MTKQKDNPVINSMKQGQPLILLNTETKTPTYRMLVQTSKELPAHDMGYDKLRYKPETIEKKIKQLEGRFVYDETQTSHNKRTTPESRGHKFAKIIKTGYCPSYGGYADLKVFDKNYHELMKEAYNSIKDGLPLHEGPSTELNVNTAELYDKNNLDVLDWDYTGIVWDNNPRDTGVGVCKVLNSIKEVLEDKNMAEGLIEDKEFVKISIEDYDRIKDMRSELDELKDKYTKGERAYLEGKQLYEDVLTEKEDLYKQLVPVWTMQGEQKQAMVNSILETIPEAEKEAKRADLEKLDITGLGVIVNSLPQATHSQEHGIVNGGQGSGRTPAAKDDFNAETDEIMLKLKAMGYI